MPIYLQEEPHVTAGMEEPYADGVSKIIYPMLTSAGPVLRMRPVGAFRVDTAHGEWSNFLFLWSYPKGWTDYAQERGPRDRSESEAHQSPDPKMSDYVRNAGNWRDRSIEDVLIPLDFSPTPEPAPARHSAHSILLHQTFKLAKGQTEVFLRELRDVVVPAAAKENLKLELIGARAGRLREFIAYWSLRGWEGYGAFKATRNPHSESRFLPGSENLWQSVDDMTEKTLHPFAYSPLGGGAD